jgi:asparagine N-glycosylation enzyme membrane subunit Stt3
VAEGLSVPSLSSPADEKAPGGAAVRRAAGIAAAVLLAGFLARVANLGQALPAGAPRLGPFDELYHAFRMDEVAAGPGRVAAFDPGRGPRGAFCPWPPLYDSAAGSAARLLGARDADGMLRRVFWLPPVAGALFAAAASFLLALRLDPRSGFLGGLAISLAPPFLEASRVGAIDHHFLEPMLLVAIAGASAALARAVTARGRWTSAVALGAAISLALFVQPALLLAAGAAFATLLLFAGPDEQRGGALALLLPAIAILLFRAAQPAGYPESSWYLGTAHAACLAGAAAASAGAAFLSRRGIGRGATIAAAIPFGALVAAAFPGAAAAILPGARFFRGDPWLDTIVEFQPLFDRGWAGAGEALASLGGGALLFLAGAAGFFGGGPSRRRLAVFALFYLGATVVTRRFLVPAAPLLAVAGAVALFDWRRRGGARAAALAGGVLVAPGLLGALPLLARPPAAVPARAIPILRAAESLRAVPGGGRVLSSWSWGHAFHVAGGRPVVVDNFGASIGQTDFQNALGIVLSPREDAVAAWCRQTGVRFVALENPLTYLTVQAQAIGLSPSLFVRADPGAPPRITPGMRFSFWWRAYFDRGAAVEEPRRRAAAFRHFRLLYADAAVSGSGRFEGPAVQIWELSDGSSP